MTLKYRNPEENERLVRVVADPYEACEGAHAIAVLTEWDEFKGYDWQRIYDGMLKPAHLFDGRNLLDTQKLNAIGFKVHAIGRPSV
jgi:UDPglucose 6-dehydrogenase